jgi:GntR family transcriptional regulator
VTRPEEPTDARPLKVRISDDVRARIASGAYPAGTQLPTLDALAAEYGCSLAAVRDALTLLRQQGLVVTRQGRGSFVRAEAGTRRRLTRGRTVSRDPRRGYVFPAAAAPDEPWQTHGHPHRAPVPAPAPVAAILNLPGGSEVLRRRRVTSPAGETPFQLADTWIHPAAVADAPRVADADTGPGGYLDRLEEAGHGPLLWTETMSVRTPTPEEARLLEIPPSLPVVELTRVGTSARTHRPVEVTVCTIPSDRVELVADLERDPTARWPTTPTTPATPT